MSHLTEIHDTYTICMMHVLDSYATLISAWLNNSAKLQSLEIFPMLGNDFKFLILLSCYSRNSDNLFLFFGRVSTRQLFYLTVTLGSGLWCGCVPFLFSNSSTNTSTGSTLFHPLSLRSDSRKEIKLIVMFTLAVACGRNMQPDQVFASAASCLAIIVACNLTINMECYNFTITVISLSPWIIVILLSSWIIVISHSSWIVIFLFHRGSSPLHLGSSYHHWSYFCL